MDVKNRTVRGAPIQQRVPEAPEAEQCVVGSVLLQPDVLPEVLKIAPPAEFLDERHQTLIAVMQSMAAEGKPIDPTTLLARLRDRDLLDKAGGSATLAAAINSVPHAAHVIYYSDEVRKAAKKRRLAQAAAELGRMATNGKPIEEALAFARGALDEIDQPTGRTETAGRVKLPADLKPTAITAIVDTREQCPLQLDLPSEVGTLDAGDYSVAGLEHVIRIERKGDDLPTCCGTQREMFMDQVMRLRGFPSRAIVTEMSWEQIEAGDWRAHVTPASVIGTLLGVMELGVPVLTAGSRERAGKMVSRLLFTCARRRYRECRALVAGMTDGEGQK